MSAGDPQPVLLFSPLTLRGVTIRNRIMLAPMNQHWTKDGAADDWLLVHLGKFALGGFGIVCTEATAIEPRGRVGYGDLGIWSDDHIPGLRRVTQFIRAQGATSAVQLAHSGRKGGSQRPWEGFGPLGESDAARGEPPWSLVGPTTDPAGSGHPTPEALSDASIESILDAYANAAARADAAGFDMIEVHGGHGYLVASFLSPISNTRNDRWGGDLAGRMRFGLEVARAIRSRWPENKPLAFRISSVDGHPQGWQIADSIVFARELSACGVDIVDCSSGGLRGVAALESADRQPGYQVPYAAQIRREAGVPTIAVGLILDGRQAETILQRGEADVVALARQALYDPFWPLHAAQLLGVDPDFTGWAPSSGWWLNRRAKDLARIDRDPAGNMRADTATR